MSPTIFISSTIADLRDLRSAVRYVVEQLGFEVLASESNDFPHELIGEAWRAALTPIDHADYFVLLVGWRAGWITPDGISVTHAEFRRARELARLAGRPLIVTIARGDVLRAYRSRQESPSLAEGWTNIVSLLDEIHRVENPTDSTWVHSFDDFEQIATTLRTAMRVTGPLRKRALEAGLLEEFQSVAEALLVRVKDTVGPITRLLPVATTTGALDRMVIFRMSIPDPSRLSAVALDQAILSGEFLDFEASSGAMTVGSFQRDLIRLRERIARYRTLHSLLASETYAREFGRMTPIGGRHAPSATFVQILFAIRDELDNIERLMRSLSRFLAQLDSTLAQTALNPPSPIPEEAARIEAELVGREAALSWLLAQT